MWTTSIRLQEYCSEYYRCASSDDCFWAVLERAAGSTQLPGLLPFPEKSVVQRLDGGQVDTDSLGLGTTAEASLEVQKLAGESS